MHTEGFISLTSDLRGLGPQRVWSLMISLFGDLAQDAGQTIGGPVLSEIMGRLQIKPEATRVALHRLRNDGWITSQKTGRISHHGLTGKGRAESAQASPRIYADPTIRPDEWKMILTESASGTQASELAAQGFIQLTSRVFAGPLNASAPPQALVLSSADTPDWLRQQVAPHAQLDGYRKLLGVLSSTQAGLPNANVMNPIEIAVLRCLVVHNWRRLVLRHTKVPMGLIDPSGPVHQCHIRVADLLERYPRPKLLEMERCHATA